MAGRSNSRGLQLGHLETAPTAALRRPSGRGLSTGWDAAVDGLSTTTEGGLNYAALWLSG